MSDNNTLFLFGGTGGLGMEVAQGLVTAEGFDSKKAIVRDASSDKAKSLETMGWTLVELKDIVGDAKGLEDALQGAKTVVSTVGGNDMVPLETAVIQASKKAGASLFVPSQFGVDFRRWGTEFPFLGGKKKVLEAAEEQGLPTLCVFSGYFSDWIFSFFIDVENISATWVGDGNTKLSFTKRSDIGYVLAKALADPAYEKGGFLAMQGSFVSFNEATELISKTMGKEFTVEYMDPEKAKAKEMELLEAGLKGDVGSFYGSFKLHLMGEPYRGNTGCDLSEIYNNYGHKMATLEEVFASVYGSS
mmetsp:Transcript_1071/g.2954  ORF Transcript_1071/g.2954 Transcript_1071/m.2954 type:complete len:303 (-) Transcript_1071:1246-2154(-)